MILSILDNDLYKFTMQQAVRILYPETLAEYTFTNRGATPFPQGFAPRVRQEIEKMAALSLSRDQKAYLKSTCSFLEQDYLDYLESYTYDPDQVILGQEKNRFFLKIKGPWYKTILWEIPLMAIISETFFSMTKPAVLSRKEIKRVNKNKAAVMAANQIYFAEFGTRRRFSAANQKTLITDILSHDTHTLIGTSNVHFAREFNLPPIGTMAHEWIMFHGAQAGYEQANAAGLDAWLKIFKGDLGIALADTYTSRVFLSSFDDRLANIFDGVRHDSGDPIAFINALVRHYERLHIDPATKTIIFSDGLDIEQALAIHKACKGKIKDAYGIGTHLTNDLGATPLNMVIKLSQCQVSPDKPWQQIVKLSDDKGKHTGNQTEIDTCMERLSLSKGQS